MADALAQCRDHEIVAGLQVDCGLSNIAAWVWVEGNSALIEQWRHAGQRRIRKEIREHSLGVMPDENKAIANATLLKLAEQYLAGWSRETVSDKVQKAIDKALKDASKSGGKLRVAG